MPDTTYLTNHLLIAMPSMEDPHFSQTVTYICEHTSDGAMGITINRPIDVSVRQVFKQLEIDTNRDELDQMPVYAGGPVLQERGFLLHRPHGKWDSSLAVTDSVAVTTSQDILTAMAKGEGPDDVLFCLGYAGWEAGQLEAEMVDNAWLTAPAEERLLFETPAEDRWNQAARLIGIDPSLLSSSGGHA
ncbi:MAG: YqgE/AlgH family protein [Gammaproteobacteria bacterium]|nr:YqgE/AlgH family protein [Gammaproteobacteria bacterium]